MVNRIDFDRSDSMFQPAGLLGWERAMIDAAIPSPELDHAPIWTESSPPDHVRNGPNYVNLASGLVIGLAVGCGGGVASMLGVAFGGFVILGSVLFVCVVAAAAAFREQRRRVESTAWSAAQHAKFVQRQTEWRRRVHLHELLETQRVSNSPMWYPIAPHRGFEGLDIFGGGIDGWRCILATVGTSLLRAEVAITVLDFTERELADGLATFVSRLGCPVMRVELPHQCSPLDLFGPLAVNDLAEVVAESIASTRRTHPDAAVLRRRDVGLVKSVAEQLNPSLPVTFARLAAGLRILRRIAHEDSRLTRDEVGRLSGLIDIVGTGDRVREEMEYLSSLFDLLADGTPDSPPSPPPCPSTGLLILSTGSAIDERKTTTDHLVFHRVLHSLRRNAEISSGHVLIFALPDRFDEVGVMAMIRHANRNNIRTIMMAPHLRDGMRNLLGSSGNPTVLMKLNNADGARTAGEFVGHGYKFVRSQQSWQGGSTFTHGWGQSLSTSNGATETLGTSTGREDSTSISTSGSPTTLANSRGRSRGSNESTSWSRNYSFTDSVNDSIAESINTSDTDARVYEYTVEPTTVQSLEPTEFILVDTGRSRRVVLGDCNPQYAFMKRVSRQPRSHS
ncbi:hypothetical protein [Nocardia noduli]|uniref:hypothetical protein n=1 Tax=Nocardia noduli TaxID=2815722 RepID=UPI001C211C70|nr:hypothetical protein [Nocardia noduli]